MQAIRKLGMTNDVNADSVFVFCFFFRVESLLDSRCLISLPLFSVRVKLINLHHINWVG